MDIGARPNRCALLQWFLKPGSENLALFVVEPFGKAQYNLTLEDLMKNFLQRFIGEERAEAVRDWAIKNRDNLLWGLAAVVVVVAFFAYTQKNKSSAPKGQWEYIQAIYGMSTGDTAQAVPLLQQLSQQHKNSRWGKRALYYLGYYYLSNGDQTKAEEYFQSYLSAKPKDKFTEANTYASIASIKADQGDLAQAQQLLKKASEIAPYETYKAFYTYRMARIMEIAGNTGDALEVYKQVKKEYEKTPAARDANTRILFLQGVAAAQGKQGG